MANPYEDISFYQEPNQGALAQLFPEEEPDSSAVPGALSQVRQAPAGELQAARMALRSTPTQSQMAALQQQLQQQLQLQRAAAERYARAYEAPIDYGYDPELMAFGQGLKEPGIGKEWERMGEVRRRLAEQKWAKGVGAEKIRAEAEHQQAQEMLGQARGQLSTLQRTDLQPIKLDDGSWATFNKRSGEVSPLASADAGRFEKARREFYRIATENKMPDAEQWAIDQAYNALKQKPAVQLSGQPATPPIPPEKAAELAQRVAPGTRLPSAPGPIPEPVRPLQYKDVAKEAGEKGYEHKQGEQLAVERKAMSDMFQANTSLETKLSQLHDLYSSGTDLASGPGAEVIAAIKSWGNTIGIPGLAKAVSAEDVIRSIATNLSLHARTADGSNLLPGQMSNYEDQLLQKMGPSLLLSKDGRLALISTMMEVAKSNQRLAKSADRYAAEHGGRLDAGWLEEKNKIAEEEMKRLEEISKKNASRVKAPASSKVEGSRGFKLLGKE